MNFGEMVALIADDLTDERLSNTQIQNAINQAIKFYGRKTFYFNTTRTSTQAVAGQEYYSLFDNAVDIADTYSLQIVRYSTADKSVALLPAEDAAIEREAYTGTSTPYAPTLPKYYAYAQMQLRIFPVPAEDGYLTIIATTKNIPLTVDVQTNAFLERADELIRQAAKRYLAYNVLHDNALGDRVAAMEAEEFASLRSETMAREPAVPMRAPTDLIALALATDVYDVVTDR